MTGRKLFAKFTPLDPGSARDTLARVFYAGQSRREYRPEGKKEVYS